MNHKPGDRLGPFEVVGLLGAGGMGEVYRARDPRLGRDVALKVLPASVSSDPERLRRFEIEARAVGALNHPNVLAIFDVGAQDGAPYVVSELLEGETLRERLGTPLPVRKALEIGAQIARGLAAAHEKGVVHRDLKPVNVFVTRDGRVKILDFGLAKLAQPEGRAGTDVDTRSWEDDEGTSPGTVMGTVGYMSPEQVRGQQVGPRSDVFSLGVILFEMLTGRRAFAGATAPETMSAILRDDPLAVAGALSPALARIVRRCLEKNPEERFHSAQDLAFDLSSLADSGESNRLSLLPQAGRRWRQAWIGAALALAATGVFVAGRLSSPTLPLPLFRQITFREGAVLSARFAPDGETVVYSAEWPGRPLEMFSTYGASLAARPLGITDAKLLSISRQGELAILLRPRMTTVWIHRGTLARVPLGGGSPRELAEEVQEAEWSLDGQSLAVVRWIDERCRLEYPMGKTVYEPAPPAWVSNLRLSPRGDRFAFFEHPVANDLRGSLTVMDLSGNRRTLAQGFVTLVGSAWSSSDEILFAGSRGNQQVVLSSVELGGGGERALVRLAGSLELLDRGPEGGVLMRRDIPSNVIRARTQATDHELDLSEKDYSFISDLSADGTTLVGTTQDTDNGADLGSTVFLKRTDGSPSVRLGAGDALALSPDRKWVLARLPPQPDEKLVVVPTGAGEMRELPAGNVAHFFEAKWFPDAARVIFSGQAKGGGRGLFVQELQGGPPRPIGGDGYALPSLGSAVSPDGRRLVAFSPDGSPVLYPTEGGEATPITNLLPGDVPIAWTTDGRSLFFYEAEGEAARVQRLDLATGDIHPVRELLASRPTGMVGQFRILVTPDARTLVHSHSRVRGDLFLATGIQ